MNKDGPFNVEYYNYRVEFQLRGAGHIHGTLFIQFDLLVNTMNKNILEMNKTKEIKSEKYLDIEKKINDLWMSKKSWKSDPSKIETLEALFIDMNTEIDNINKNSSEVIKLKRMKTGQNYSKVFEKIKNEEFGKIETDCTDKNNSEMNFSYFDRYDLILS